MTDHLRFIVALFCLKEWEQTTNIRLDVRVDRRTGEIKNKRRKNSNTIMYDGEFEGFKLIVFEVQHLKDGKYTHSTYRLWVEGSIHKNAFNGRNYERLYFEHYHTELSRICKALDINPAIATLLSFEYGVNVKPSIEVQDIVENWLVTYSTKEFIKYQPGKKGRSLGKVAKLGEYSVKCYNKGPQYGLTENKLRFELRFSRLRRLKQPPYCIRTLADLLDKNKLGEVSNLLIRAWSKVLLCDPQLPNKATAEEHRELMISGKNPLYWMNMVRKQSGNRKIYYRLRAVFIKLTQKYSDCDLHSEIAGLIKKEVDELLG
ncbi:MAG: hypothetical protein JNL72_15120 [Flavipsychrobacter sp.]|nr:hypothetical protein [Flavipsychrobacter sp.]